MTPMLHLFSMKFFRSILLLVFLAPGTLLAQGVKMSADFLPLEVGNRWVYEIANEDGKKIGDLDFSVQEYTIIGGRGRFLVDRCSLFAPGTGASQLSPLPPPRLPPP